MLLMAERLDECTKLLFLELNFLLIWNDWFYNYTDCYIVCF